MQLDKKRKIEIKKQERCHKNFPDFIVEIDQTVRDTSY